MLMATLMRKPRLFQDTQLMFSPGTKENFERRSLHPFLASQNYSLMKDTKLLKATAQKLDLHFQPTLPLEQLLYPTKKMRLTLVTCFSC